MPTIESRISRGIHSVRSRARTHGNHIAEYETRTKYALIDPLLGALGWNLANPAQVKLELEIKGGRIDYAFFKSGLENPVVLLEAKRLTPKAAGEFKEFSDRKQVAVSQSWEQFREGNELRAEPVLLEEWSRILTDSNESQLGIYAHNLQLKTGYGVLTNGNEWQIYDMSKTGDFPEKLISTVNILTAPIADSTEKLKILWSGNKKWPGM